MDRRAAEVLRLSDWLGAGGNHVLADRDPERKCGPINLLVCATCLTLMYFESAISICIGCKIHNTLPNRRAQHCAGGTAIVLLFLALVGVTGQLGFPAARRPGEDRCTPPAFAVVMGHAEKWKLHNNCK